MQNKHEFISTVLNISRFIIDDLFFSKYQLIYDFQYMFIKINF